MRTKTFVNNIMGITAEILYAAAIILTAFTVCLIVYMRH
jgi:hypothetical protein